MTSNVGSQAIAAYAGRPVAGESGYEAMKREVLGMLRGTFRPEFLNRVDEVIVFHALTEDDLARSSTCSWPSSAAGWPATTWCSR